MIDITENTARAPRLSIRVQGQNPLHHLWNNHGTWWIHYTVHPDVCTKARVRRSLRTRDLALAQARRDAILGAVRGPVA